MNFRSKSTTKAAIMFSIVYIAIMAIGMAVMHDCFNYTYQEAGMVKIMVFVMAILSAFVFVIAKTIFGFKNIGFSQVDKKGLWWFVPLALVVGTMLVCWLVLFAQGVNSLTSEQFALIVITAVMAAMIGFAEETMFRGILLHTLCNNGRSIMAVLISALFFSLLHSINVLGGLSPSLMVIQLGLTFITGVAFGFLALRMTSIIPLIILHFLWDLITLCGRIIGGAASNFVSILFSINIILAIALFVLFKARDHRGSQQAE